MTTPKIYLAGKVGPNDWRAEYVAGLREAYTTSDLVDGNPWPELQGAIHGCLTYVGPFFVSDDHGCAHGPEEHGMGASNGGVCGNGYTWPQGHGPGWYSDGNHGFAHRDSKTDPYKIQVAEMCFDAIRRADVVIAVPTSDSHGTLVEIGYAIGQGKEVIVCYPDEETQKTVWFPGALRGVYPQDHTPDVAEALESLAALEEYSAECQRKEQAFLETLARCESPIEERFFRHIRWTRYLPGLQPAVTVMGGKYRLDFAITDKKFAIELDGYEYHNSREQFTRDRKRQRELELEGWRIIRFSGAEVMADTDRCISQAHDLLMKMDTE